MLGNITERSLPKRLAKRTRRIADLIDQGAWSIGVLARQFLVSPNVSQRFGDLVLRGTPRPEVFSARVRERRKVAIISTYHNFPFFLTYHYRLADTLSAAGFVVYFVHAGEAWSPLLLEIDRNDIFLCMKNNAGFDFGSYAVGFHLLKDMLEHVDELLFANDSIIGPATDMHDIFSEIRSSGADFAGMTDSYERGYHLQTYFIWLGRNAVQSRSLISFFDNPRFAGLAHGSERRKHMLRERMVRDGELAFTRLLLEARLQGYALCPYQQVASRWLAKLPALVQLIANLPGLEPRTAAEASSYLPFKLKLLEGLDAIAASVVSGTPLNPTIFFWDVLIEDFRFPFIKRELVTANPRSIPSYFRISDVLQSVPRQLTDYVIEVQRYWGGTRVPFIEKPRSDMPPILAVGEGACPAAGPCP